MRVIQSKLQKQTPQKLNNQRERGGGGVTGFASHTKEITLHADSIITKKTHPHLPISHLHILYFPVFKIGFYLKTLNFLITCPYNFIPNMFNKQKMHTFLCNIHFFLKLTVLSDLKASLL